MTWGLRLLRVNLALAYTELTEELGRLRELSALQGRILRTLLQEQTRGGERRAGPGGPRGGSCGATRCPTLRFLSLRA